MRDYKSFFLLELGLGEEQYYSLQYQWNLVYQLTVLILDVQRKELDFLFPGIDLWYLLVVLGTPVCPNISIGIC